eukprot:12910323-Prorocentrum_lima.AAC.1
MEWSLWEAVRNAHRRFLTNASSVAVSLDERSERILSRCVVCFGKGVMVVTSVLAQLKQEGTCADEIVECVHEA